MNTRDPLQCTFDDARRATLMQGIALREKGTEGINFLRGVWLRLAVAHLV